MSHEKITCASISKRFSPVPTKSALSSAADRTLPKTELAAIEPLLRRIGLAIVVQQNRELAHALVDQAFAPREPDYDERDPQTAPLSVVLPDLKLYNIIFEAFACTTAGAFVTLDPREFHGLPNVGLRRAEELVDIWQKWRRKIAEAQSV